MLDLVVVEVEFLEVDERLEVGGVEVRNRVLPQTEALERRGESGETERRERGYARVDDLEFLAIEEKRKTKRRRTRTSTPVCHKINIDADEGMDARTLGSGRTSVSSG